MSTSAAIPRPHTAGDSKKSSAMTSMRTRFTRPTVSRPGRTRATTAMSAAAAWLDGYFAGEAPSPACIPLAPEGTDFQRHVWEAMDAIPYGATHTYGHLTATLRDAGVPASAQAIGGAVGRNPLLIFRPCHRVVAASGPGGYAAGGAAKAWLLAHEAATASPAN